MKTRLLSLVFVAGAAMLGGCAVRGGYFASGPPAPRYGVVGMAPGPGYVWTEGYWDRHGNDWAWVGGRWMRPPRGRTAYVAPRWEQHGHGWRMRRGHWR